VLELNFMDMCLTRAEKPRKRKKTEMLKEVNILWIIIIIIRRIKQIIQVSSFQILVKLMDFKLF